MCIICIELAKGSMTHKEAFKAMGEMMTPDNQKHLEEVADNILNQEVPMAETNAEADEAFWNATHQED